MKLSDQIRRIRQATGRQASDIEQSDVLGPGGEDINVDEATEAEDADVVSQGEQDKLQQGSRRTIPDTGFLSAAEKHLLRKHGYQIVAVDYIDEQDKMIQKEMDRTVNLFLTQLKKEVAGLKKVYKDPKKVRAVLLGRYDFLTDKIFKKLGL